MQIKEMTRLSMYASLAVILSIFESFIPFLDGYTIPGIKLGLANIVILYVLYTYSFKEALYITLLKVGVVAICRTGLFSYSFYFSLTGSLLSIISMGLLKKTNLFSVLGVSIIGSLTHSLGQILVASVLLNMHLLQYIELALFLCIPTGLFTGYVSKQLLKNTNRLEKRK